MTYKKSILILVLFGTVACGSNLESKPQSTQSDLQLSHSNCVDLSGTYMLKGTTGEYTVLVKQKNCDEITFDKTTTNPYNFPSYFSLLVPNKIPSKSESVRYTRDDCGVPDGCTNFKSVKWIAGSVLLIQSAEPTARQKFTGVEGVAQIHHGYSEAQLEKVSASELRINDDVWTKR